MYRLVITLLGFYLAQLILCISALGQEEVKMIKGTYPEVTHECEFIKSVDTHKYGDPPVWSDPRLTTLEGRQQIIAEACANVLKYIGCCYPDIAIGRILSLTDCEASKHWGNIMVGFGIRNLEIFSNPKRNNSGNSLLKVTYVQIQRLPNKGARSIYAGSYLHWPGGYITCYTAIDYEKTGPVRSYQNEYRCEYFHDLIEVFPAVFERGELFMESEVGSQEGPWAKTPAEALEYIILHELGHLESYIATHSEIRQFDKIEDTEDECDIFASSVLRCQQR